VGWNLHHVDVNTAFLNGVIKEEVYIEQPQGFEIHARESHICQLKKALYGLNQAHRARYSQIDNYLTRLGFSKIDVDLNLYVKVEKNELVIGSLMYLVSTKPDIFFSVNI